MYCIWQPVSVLCLPCCSRCLPSSCLIHDNRAIWFRDYIYVALIGNSWFSRQSQSFGCCDHLSRPTEPCWYALCPRRSWWCFHSWQSSPALESWHITMQKTSWFIWCLLAGCCMHLFRQDAHDVGDELEHSDVQNCSDSGETRRILMFSSWVDSHLIFCFKSSLLHC